LPFNQQLKGNLKGKFLNFKTPSMKQINLFKILAGLSMLTCSVAILIFALKYSPVNAAEKNIQTTGGKIMMHQNSFVYNNQFYYNILVWDSETGKSKLYYTNSKEWVLDTQLPSSPLY
jgi:hypothetical protein